MIGQELLSERRAHLLSVLKDGLRNSRTHTLAFVLRILPSMYQDEFLKENSVALESPLATPYGGYPDVALLGFSLASDTLNTDLATKFIEGCERLQKRDSTANRAFFLDDIAILGVAEGLVFLPQATQERAWLLEGIERHSGQSWSSRMRQLAADLLDNRGRLKVGLHNQDIDSLALELVLRRTWGNAFLQTAPFAEDIQLHLLKELLSATIPSAEDTEKVAIWLIALDGLVYVSSQSLLPTVSDTARILNNVEHSFKRWFWEDKPRPGISIPAQWLIDNEYHIQAILWAVLYPIYGSELVDETYLPNWGQTQPRADLGILNLQLIIEVKFLRDPSDFQKVEGEIGNDLGLYFKDTDLFNRMIVFIYDDCDKHQPQRYASLQNALMKRERIEDVIIVRRPGMLPSRSERRPSRSRLKSKDSS